MQKINRAEFSKNISEETYDLFLLTLRRHLLNGNMIAFKNIGTFSTVRKPAKVMKVGGKSVEVEESIRIKFKQSRNFKPKVKQSQDAQSLEKLLAEMKKKKA